MPASFMPVPHIPEEVKTNCCQDDVSVTEEAIGDAAPVQDPAKKLVRPSSAVVPVLKVTPKAAEAEEYCVDWFVPLHLAQKLTVTACPWS